MHERLYARNYESWNWRSFQNGVLYRVLRGAWRSFYGLSQTAANLTGDILIATGYANIDVMAEIPRAPRRSIFRLAWRRREAVLFVTILAVVAGLAFVTITRPVLETTAIVGVEILNPTGPDAQSLSDGPVALQAQVMQSKPVVATALVAPGIGNLDLIKSTRDPLNLIESNLSVRPTAQPGEFELVLTSNSPPDAQKILDAITSEYIRFETSQQRKNQAELEAGIQNQLQKLDAEISVAQKQMDGVRAQTTATNALPQSRELIARHRAELSAQLVQATRDATDAQAEYESAKSSGDPPPALVEKYQTTQTHRADLQSQFDAMEKQSEQMDAADNQSIQLDTELGQLQSAKAALVNRLDNWNRAPENQLSLTISQSAQTSSTVIWPRPLPVLGITALAGILLGMAIVGAKDRFSSWLQDSEDISLTAQAPILGRLPIMPQELSSPDMRAQGVLLRPNDEAAEACEQIRAELEKSLIPGMRKTILITSPSTYQGKSMFASNLAITMARRGLHVALIDANFYRPAIGDVFGVDDPIGLSDAIEGKIKTVQALRVTGLPGLEVMPAGYANTALAELFNRPEFAEVLNELSERFDRVVIDGDCARMDECRILSSFCDATVMVVHSEGGRRSKLLHAVDGLRTVGANLMGIVLNDLPRIRPSARMKGQPHAIPQSTFLSGESKSAQASVAPHQSENLRDEIIDLGKLAGHI